MAADSVAFANGVFCPPLPGKLGPYKSDGVSRERVCQSAQKGGNCHYYALQILRGENRIGNHPLVPPLLSARMEAGLLGESERIQLEKLIKKRSFCREGEKIASAYRKGKQKLDDCFGLIFAVTKQYDHLSAQEKNTRVAAKRILGACKEYGKEESDPQGYRKLFIDTLEAFLRQDVCDNFMNYLHQERYKARSNVNQPLFDYCQLSQEDIQRASLKPWDDLNVNEKYVRESIAAFACLRSIFSCENSSWDPSQGPQALIDQLKTYGPHLVCGLIGKSFYKEAPSQQPNLVQGRQIHFWKVGSKINESSVGHVIVIVGAQIQNGKGYVYFLDPEDGSDPKDLKSQKVYVMSYDKLKEKMTSLDGYQLKEISEDRVFSSEKFYAVHMGVKREDPELET